MNEVGARGRGGRIGGARLARLVEAAAEAGLGAVERFYETIGDVVVERRPRQDEAPRADRLDRLALAGIASGGDRQAFQEGVPGEDALAVLGARHDEAAARLRDPRKTRPADA